MSIYYGHRQIFGEADFKINSYLNENQATLINAEVAIASMDNDLLLLAINSPMNRLYNILPNKRNDELELRVLNIKEIRQILAQHIKDKIANNEDMVKEFYKDLILLEGLRDGALVPPIYGKYGDLIYIYYGHRRSGNPSLINFFKQDSSILN